jgi:hypothetical protein
MQLKSAHNSCHPEGVVSYSIDSFTVNGSLVFQIGFSAWNPPCCQAAKRWPPATPCKNVAFVPGEHAASIEAGNPELGVYFITLRHAGFKQARRPVMVRWQSVVTAGQSAGVWGYTAHKRSDSPCVRDRSGMPPVWRSLCVGGGIGAYSPTPCVFGQQWGKHGGTPNTFYISFTYTFSKLMPFIIWLRLFIWCNLCLLPSWPIGKCPYECVIAADARIQFIAFW